jgi:hypothetical protein
MHLRFRCCFRLRLEYVDRFRIQRWSLTGAPTGGCVPPNSVRGSRCTAMLRRDAAHLHQWRLSACPGQGALPSVIESIDEFALRQPPSDIMTIG